jgi:hypothetical protein
LWRVWGRKEGGRGEVRGGDSPRRRRGHCLQRRRRPSRRQLCEHTTPVPAAPTQRARTPPALHRAPPTNGEGTSCHCAGLPPPRAHTLSSVRRRSQNRRRRASANVDAPPTSEEGVRPWTRPVPTPFSRTGADAEHRQTWTLLPPARRAHRRLRPRRCCIRKHGRCSLTLKFLAAECYNEHPGRSRNTLCR